jgi:hypothetical protein
MFAEAEALAADLAGAPARLAELVPPVVSKGALNVKNDWRANASGNKHAPHYPASITYDLHGDATSIEAEIGPDKNLKQGPLGNILEFGTSKNPPHLDGARALAAEEPRFIAACEAVAEQALFG